MATDNKYDRQLRLWGSSGQQALSESVVVLVNASAAGTETLKNLVLPGIGSFHIVDDQVIDNTNSSGQHFFSNFFVFNSPSSIGSNAEKKSRAEIATIHLSELNPDVQGNFTFVNSLHDIEFSSLLSTIAKEHSSTRALNENIMQDATSDQYVKPKNMIVIAADLPPPILLKLSSTCWNFPSSSIPLVIVRSYGLIGTVRIQVQYHPIIESRPDNSVPDLRIVNTYCAMEPFGTCAFPRLRALADSINLDSMDKHEHGHVPYAIILVKALDQWLISRSKANVSNDETIHLLPATVTEKEQFRSMVKAMSRDFSNETNFQEAYNNAYLAYSVPELPWEVKELIDSVDSRWKDSSIRKQSFDILVLALHRFINRSSSLSLPGFIREQPPLNGTIPDMTSSTTRYIQLNQVYKGAADEDRVVMRTLVDQIHQEFSSSLSYPLDNVSDDELALFCKNTQNLRVIRTRSYADEYQHVYDSNEEKEEVISEIMNKTVDPYDDPNQTPLLWAIVLRACDAYYDRYGQYPGYTFSETSTDCDIEALQLELVTLLEKLNLAQNPLIQSTLLSTDDHMHRAFVKEAVRFGNSEIHTIASLVAGVASQEVVKILTRQYIPIDGTYVFNGIASTADVYKF